ncbi:Ribose methyltransferase [Globomyces sp. JEL0801]|nr:Ribose methyltransferase [Globomyces sp. JEL0801]
MLNTRRAFPLWLDRVVDPQNLGAIIRTAYFFGVDGVVITDKESAPLNPTVSKASSGAMEVMDIFKTSSISKFIQESSEAGWYIYGTDLKGGPEKSLVIDPTYETPSLLHSPTILVMGNEGIGLRSSVTKLCDKHLILKSEREEEMTTSKYQIDSLNVSVAAGILIQRILDS